MGTATSKPKPSPEDQPPYYGDAPTAQAGQHHQKTLPYKVKVSKVQKKSTNSHGYSDHIVKSVRMTYKDAPYDPKSHFR